jgi:phospholipid/cholesterol/gamma-HCH transport system substrate-binding protein
MKRFSERDPRQLGVVGFLVVALILGLALNTEKLTGLLGGTSYSAIFNDAGGLTAGDEVQVSGMPIGRVDGTNLVDDGVEVTFTVTDDSGELGDTTRAVVKVSTILGKKYLGLEPSGSGELSSEQPIPLGRTESPYDLPEVLSTLTDRTSQIDVDQVSRALDTVSESLTGTAPELRDALAGLTRLSESVNSRDDALSKLLGSAENVSGVLAQRSDQLRLLVADGNLLLGELQRRRDTISELLERVSALSEQLTHLVEENRGQFGPTLERLNAVLETLKANRDNIQRTVTGLAGYASGLGEALSSGPFFSAYIVNLVAPGNLVPVNDLLDQLDRSATPSPGGPR